MRQGQSAVQASLELDVTSVEYSEEDLAMAGDMVRKYSFSPPGI